MSIDVNQANEGLRAHSRGGIAAVIAVNSGAMIALLSQLGSLRSMIEMGAIKHAFSFWITGVVAGLFCWLFATWAASAHANMARKLESALTVCGYLVWLLSTACFAIGAVWVLYSFK